MADVSRSRTLNPSPDRALDQFGFSCARVERVSLDERLNAARQVRHKIYKNALDNDADLKPHLSGQTPRLRNNCRFIMGDVSQVESHRHSGASEILFERRGLRLSAPG